MVFIESCQNPRQIKYVCVSVNPRSAAQTLIPRTSQPFVQDSQSPGWGRGAAACGGGGSDANSDSRLWEQQPGREEWSQRPHPSQAGSPRSKTCCVRREAAVLQACKRDAEHWGRSLTPDGLVLILTSQPSLPSSPSSLKKTPKRFNK